MTPADCPDFDPAAPEKASIDVEIEPASIDTGIADRDNHLRSPDFFDAGKFPKLSFKSTKVVRTAAGKYAVSGNLTIRGVTRPVVLAVEGLDTAYRNPFSGKQARGATATATISRKDFGLTWNKALEAGGLLVGDEVRIVIETELLEKK